MRTGNERPSVPHWTDTRAHVNVRRLSVRPSVRPSIPPSLGNSAYCRVYLAILRAGDEGEKGKGGQGGTTRERGP